MPLSLLVLLLAMFHVHVCMSKCRTDRSYCNVTTYEHEGQDAKVLDALTAQRAFLNGDVYVSIIILFRCISCMMMIICILLASNYIYNTGYGPTISS